MVIKFGVKIYSATNRTAWIIFSEKVDHGILNSKRNEKFILRKKMFAKLH
jgi:hypothetical protein